MGGRKERSKTQLRNKCICSLKQSFQKKIVRQFFFVSLKPWSSESSAISAVTGIHGNLSQIFFQKALKKCPQKWPHLKILKEKDREVNVVTHCNDCWWGMCVQKLTWEHFSYWVWEFLTNVWPLSWEKVRALREEMKSMRDIEADQNVPKPEDIIQLEEDWPGLKSFITLD